jgi:hypothetical protein
MPSWRSKLPIVLVVLASFALPARAADDAVLGKWNCVAESSEGTVASVWHIKETGGALQVDIEIETVNHPGQQVELEGRTLTLAVEYQSVLYDLSVTFDGDAFAGTWSGNGLQGPLKGRRASTS